MNTKNKTAFLAKAALFGAALIWGSSFIMMKTTIDNLAPCYLLAFRFAIASLVLAAIFHKKLRLLNKEYLWQGAFLGFLLFGGYCVQTYGLAETTPGRNAFLTTIYCVIVPFFYWLADRIKPDRYNISAAVLCVSGIGFVSLNGSFSIGRGDLLSILCGFLFAAHIVFIAKYNRSKDAVLLTILQFGFASFFSLIAAVFFEAPPQSFTASTIKSLLYLAVFASAIALCLQNVGQKYTTPSAASIILSLESVFGIIFSVILYGEKLTPRLLVGFALIFISVIISETKLSFLPFLARSENSGLSTD